MPTNPTPAGRRVSDAALARPSLARRVGMRATGRRVTGIPGGSYMGPAADSTTHGSPTAGAR